MFNESFKNNLGKKSPKIQKEILSVLEHYREHVKTIEEESKDETVKLVCRRFTQDDETAAAFLSIFSRLFIECGNFQDSLYAASKMYDTFQLIKRMSDSPEEKKKHDC